MVDFERTSAIERLSLQNNERTHAEMLAWLFSESSRLGGDRVALLRELLGGEAFVELADVDGWKFEEPRTEVVARPAEPDDEGEGEGGEQDEDDGAKKKRPRFDLVLALERGGQRYGVLFEYKMKSTESAQQLAGYDAVEEHVFRGIALERRRKVLVTFAGDPPTSGTRWLARSYRDLRRSIAAVSAASDSATALYVADYVKMLDRMLACLEEVQGGSVAAAALLAKEPPPGLDARLSKMRAYVDVMRFRHLLMKAWLSKVLERVRQKLGVPFPTTRIQAGQNIRTGGAILNVYLAELTSADGGRFRHGLQVQETSFRSFTEPFPDRKLQQEEVAAANALHAALTTIVQAAPTHWTIGSRKVIREGENGFRSKSARVLDIDGRPTEPSSLRGDFDIDRWASAVAAALIKIQAFTQPGHFPGFAWQDLHDLAD